MKPLNEKERRNGIFKFLGLLLVAMLPLLFLVYEFSRVDATENDRLRKVAAKCDWQSMDNSKIAKTRQLIEDDIDELSRQVQQALNEPNSNNANSISATIDALREHQVQLANQTVGRDSVQQHYSVMMGELIPSLLKLNEDLYSEYYNSFRDEKRAFADYKAEIE